MELFSIRIQRTFQLVSTKSKERFIVEIFFNVFIKYVFITK